MKLIRSIRSLTRNNRTEAILIPVYGERNGKYKQVITQTVIEIRDLAIALEYRWNLNPDGYAQHGGCSIGLHRHLLNTPKGLETDHINGVKLDNRRSNLRVATTSQNQWNLGIQSNNTSGYKGVSWNKRQHKWESRIKKDGTKFHLGLFTDKRDAAKAYNKASLKYHGEYGRLNVL